MSTPGPILGGFTRDGFTTDGFTQDILSHQVLPSWISDYYRPWRCKLEFFDKDNQSVLATYDSFLSNVADNDFHLQYLDCEPQVGNISTGTWSCIIEDSSQLIDRKQIGISNRVKISMGQTQAGYIPVFQGVVRFDQSDTSQANSLRLFMSGFGTQYIFNERLINFTRVAPKSSVNSQNPFAFDINFTASNTIKKLLTDKNLLVSNTELSARDTLIDLIGNLDLSSIDNVNTFIPGLSFFYQPAHNAFNQIADLTGTEWGVDSSTNKFYLRFPKSTQSAADSIVIKSLPDYGINRDKPEATAYIMRGSTLQIGRSMRREDGFANKLFALAGSKLRVDASSTSATGSTSLAGTAIGQQVRAGSTQLRDLALTMSKTGSPEQISQFVQGRICLDSGYDFPAESRVVSDFQINVDDIPTAAGPVYKLNLNFNEKINPGGYYWILLYQLGEEPNQSSTVSWHHDNITNDSTKHASAIRMPGAKVVDPSNPQSWTISTDGPTYAFGAFYATSHIVTASDPFSIRKWGEVDDVVTNTAIKDNQTMVQYLYSLLAFTAKPKLLYPTITTTIPSNGFKPGQLVQVIDRMSGNTEEKKTLAELLSVRYVWDARGSGGKNTAVGINTAEISLIGYLDYLEELDELSP
jgi:hypothetical protein